MLADATCEHGEAVEIFDTRPGPGNWKMRGGLSGVMLTMVLFSTLTMDDKACLPRHGLWNGDGGGSGGNL